MLSIPKNELLSWLLNQEEVRLALRGTSAYLHLTGDNSQIDALAREEWTRSMRPVYLSLCAAVLAASVSHIDSGGQEAHQRIRASLSQLMVELGDEAGREALGPRWELRFHELIASHDDRDSTAASDLLARLSALMLRVPVSVAPNQEQQHRMVALYSAINRLRRAAY